MAGRFWLLCIVATVALPAHAVDVYRCTDARGGVEYRDMPCPGQSGARVAIEPNIIREIDQSAARAASQAIADRAAARAREEDAARAARQRAAGEAQARDAAAAAQAAEQRYDMPWWQVGGPPPDRDKRPTPRDDASPTPTPPKPVVRPIAPAVQPISGR